MKKIKFTKVRGKHKILSLFSGGGLLDLGFCLEGHFKIVKAYDFDVNAVKAYEFNIGDHIEKTDISKLKIPEGYIGKVDGIVGGPPCFPAGQRIITKEGLKEIENIKTGEKVLTHKGRYKKVIKTMERKNNGYLYNIVCKYYRIPIRVTPEHPFYTKRGWVEVKDLERTDYVGFPINKKSELPNQIVYTNIINQNYSELRETNLPLDSIDFWKLIGYWLAEGWTRDKHKRNKNKMRKYYGISFAANKKKKKFICRILKKLNLKYHISNMRTCMRINITNRELWLFVKQFTTGHTAVDKIIPEFVQNLPIELGKSLIEGYFKGDGSISNGYTSFSSVSIKLLEGIQRLLLKTERRLYSLTLGNKAGTAIIEGRIVNTKNCYELKTGTNQGRCVEFTDDYVFFKIDKIKKKYVKSLTVYNLEVEKDNSYCLPLIAVHNCQDFSHAGNGEGENGVRGILVFNYLHQIKTLKPKWFLFENVKGLVSKKHIHTFKKLLKMFRKLGYKTFWKVINSWEHGVAQVRERVFIVGIRKDQRVKFSWPEPVPENERLVLRDVIGDLPEPIFNHEVKELSEKALEYIHRDPRRMKSKHRPKNMAEPGGTIQANFSRGVPYGLFYPNNTSLGDLPDYVIERMKTKKMSSSGKENVRIFDMDKPSFTLTNNVGNNPHQFLINKHDNHVCFDNVNFGWSYDKSNRTTDWFKPSPTIDTKKRCESIHPNYIPNCTGYSLRNDEKEFAHKIPPGGNWKDLPKKDQEKFMGNAINSPGGKTTFLKRIKGDKPANTITSSILGKAACQLHPNKPRRFSVRECLRIQSVPDFYVFPDETIGVTDKKEKISLSAQYKVVGNGVPTLLAYKLAKQIAKSFGLKKKIKFAKVKKKKVKY